MDETDWRARARPSLRKGFWEDHFDELSAIVRGENRKGVMTPVKGWAKKKKDTGGEEV